jgi:hypothetical protein
MDKLAEAKKWISVRYHYPRPEQPNKKSRPTKSLSLSVWSTSGMPHTIQRGSSLRQIAWRNAKDVCNDGGSSNERKYPDTARL